MHAVDYHCSMYVNMYSNIEGNCKNEIIWKFRRDFNLLFSIDKYKFDFDCNETLISYSAHISFNSSKKKNFCLSIMLQSMLDTAIYKYKLETSILSNHKSFLVNSKKEPTLLVLVLNIT